MKEIKFDRHLVIYDDYNIDKKPELTEFLESKKILNILNNLKQDVIMVLGWDWTILKAIRKHYKEQKAFLPINFGTKWFLLNDKEFINKRSEFVQREYPLMDIKVKIEDKKIKDIAFNEFVIKDTDLKTVDLNITIDEKQVLNIKWDWLLISTPAGSTAYNSSLKWPILPHSSDHFTMPYMAAWEPKLQAPTILENDSVVKIKNQWRINSLIIGADSNPILRTKPGQKVKITIKKSKYKVKLLIENSYKKSWDNKVLEEQWFNN